MQIRINSNSQRSKILTSPNAYLEIEKSVFLDFPKAAFLQLEKD